MLNYADHSLTRKLHARRAQRLAEGYRVVQFLPFVYAAEFLPLLANSSAPFNVTIDQDATFLLTASTFSSFSDAGAAQTAPNILIRLTSDAVARQLMSAQVHLLNSFGTGERPFPWFEPLELPPKTNLTVEAQNLAGVNSNLRLSFIGVKEFLER